MQVVQTGRPQLLDTLTIKIQHVKHWVKAMLITLESSFKGRKWARSQGRYRYGKRSVSVVELLAVGESCHKDKRLNLSHSAHGRSQQDYLHEVSSFWSRL
ncbi:hypothetical protein KIL84_023282 [Mauremys mutica]|uniref:Uncharacterized protein n=1 Tax=Mauremys mutica TaxID=74926 RepID=A0A9D3WSC4_9SAUR|nr:hypothetical protein KIL84_023282 [Mauremys mutica]